ncbi:MAG: hypothetical protein AABY22_09970 [Nanoarchaeota archaeon]
MTTLSNIKTWKNITTRKKRIEGNIRVRLGMSKKQFTTEVDNYVNQNKSSSEIANILKVSAPTIKKYASNKNKLFNINKNCQYKSNYKNGQSALYMKLRKEIKFGSHSCEYCNTQRNVEIHHKEKLNHKDYWKATNFNNYKENILFLCNSCHQKLHYRTLDKIHKVNHDPQTGRFLRGSFQEVAK